MREGEKKGYINVNFLSYLYYTICILVVCPKIQYTQAAWMAKIHAMLTGIEVPLLSLHKDCSISAYSSRSQLLVPSF